MSEDEDGPEDEDPFAGLTLDEQFVAGAEVTEESAADRVDRLRRIDAEHARLAREREDDRRKSSRTARRGRGKQTAVLLVVLAALAGLFAWNVARDTRGSDEATGPGAFGDDGARRAAAGSARPPGGVEDRGAPVGQPAAVAGESTSYAFIHVQAGSADPVAYDPCRPIHVVVNARTAPPGGDAWLTEALAATSRATGLQFIVDGPTDEVPTTAREAYLPDRYPGRWAPVLIAWSDPQETAMLDGSTAGVGGSAALETDDGTLYVSGSIELDGPQLGEIAASPRGLAAAQGAIQHELGHVVGLDHVEDPTQLMNPSGDGTVTTFAAGDLTGLARLGTGRCFPDV